MAQPNFNQKRIPSLDGLRGLSIWAVLLAHISAHFTSSRLHDPFVRMLSSGLAYFGVTVFFVISGFLITRLLVIEREQTSGVSLRKFYRRRAVRILPAFLVYTSAIIFFGQPTFIQRIYALTFTTSFAFDQAYRPLQQLWSLSVEEQFYLVWPLLMSQGILTARRSCWAALGVCPVLRVVLKHSGYHQYSHLGPAILDSIAAGCLLAFYHEQVRDWVRRHLISSYSFIGASVATVIVAQALYRIDLVMLWGVVPCMVAVVIAAAMERSDRLLNAGPLAWSGLLSYSLYLWQQPLLVMGGPLDYVSVRLPILFAAAWISYRLVEQPALRLFATGSGKSLELSSVPGAVPET